MRRVSRLAASSYPPALEQEKENRRKNLNMRKICRTDPFLSLYFVFSQAYSLTTTLLRSFYGLFFLPPPNARFSALTWQLSVRLRCSGAGWRAGEPRRVCGGDQASSALLSAPFKSLHWSNRRSVSLMGPDVTPPLTHPAPTSPHLLPLLYFNYRRNYILSPSSR